MNIDAAQTINTVVRNLLPTGSGPTKAVRVSVKCDLADYSAEDENGLWREECQSTGYLTLVFRCTFNYMTVWAAFTRSPQPGDFKFVGNHDSGWRGCVQTELKNLQKQVRAEIEGRCGKGLRLSERSSIESVEMIEIEADDRTIISIK